MSYLLGNNYVRVTGDETSLSNNLHSLDIFVIYIITSKHKLQKQRTGVVGAKSENKVEQK